MDVVCKKSRSDGFTLVCGQLLLLPVEINQFLVMRWKNGVLFDSVLFHFNP
jgi:hypothetical protein